MTLTLVPNPPAIERPLRKGMPDGLLAALDRLAVAAGKHRLATEILGNERGNPAPDWTPWWVER